MNDSPIEGRAESDAARPAGPPFREWFEAASLNRLDLSESQLVPARRLQYLFVSGFHNEMMPLYFWGNIRELRRQGVPSKQIRRLHPSSHATFETIVEWMQASIERFANQSPERLVIVAHSRGACLTLATALRHASWFRDRVEALFLIQGPFGGTAVADYVIEKEKPFPDTWPVHRLGLAHSLTSIERLALWLGWDAGLSELTHHVSRQFWAEEIDRHRAESGSDFAEIDRMTYFVRSSIDPRKLRFPRSELGHILQECDGPNDGVVALADQSIDGFGTRFEPVMAAHTELIWGLYSTREARSFRRALTQSIIRVLADRRPTDPDSR